MKITPLPVAAGLFMLALAACSEPQQSIFEPQYTVNSPTPVECPTAVTQSVSSWIGPFGGSLSVGGTTVTIPFGAILLPRSFTLTVPASNYMEIDVSTAGAEHFVFQKPVTVSIDYSRCTRSDIDQKPLSIWYWENGELVEDMNGTDDKAARKVTFGTPHLSGYVIAD